MFESHGSSLYNCSFIIFELEPNKHSVSGIFQKLPSLDLSTAEMLIIMVVVHIEATIHVRLHMHLWLASIAMFIHTHTWRIEDQMSQSTYTTFRNVYD